MSERRNAERTRLRLLEAARDRFTHLGFRATTVRSVAAAAGVHPALIYRYFSSKRGLLEACVANLAEEPPSPVPAPASPDGISAAITEEMLGRHGGQRSSRLLLLLASSDEPAKTAVRAAMAEVADRLPAAVRPSGTRPADADLVRAELIIATVLGVVALRTGEVLEPLASASREMLQPVVDDLLSALLGPTVES